MNKPTLTIEELKSLADQAEREAEQAFRARKDAVVRSQQAMATAAKARAKYLRAVGAQEGEADG